MVSSALATQFMELFAGSETSRGVYDMSNPIKEDSGKIRGRAVTKHDAITQAMWEQHLAGEGTGVGVVPIRNNATCVFGAIDVDHYSGLDLRSIVIKLQRSNIPLLVCRSKSGGAHIYCFSKEPVLASNMKSKLAEVAGFLGFGGCEIFPKQTQLLADRGDAGSWINPPYFGGTRGMRYCVDVEGNALSPEAFLIAAEAMKVDAHWFLELLVIANEFEDGPPCLQALAQVGYPVGTRNDGLYAMGVYLKKSRPDNWEPGLDEFNHKYMQPPLTTPEIQGVIKSLRRKEYNYACSRQPLAQHCNSSLCKTRKFGVGGGATGKFPSFGGLSMLSTTPAIWYLTVDGVRLEFTTPELQDPRSFQRKCMEALRIVVTIPKVQVWTAYLQQAMDSVTIIEAPADSSPEGQLWEHCEKFCTGRAQALALDEIPLGKPYSEKGRTYFRMQDFMAFLSRHKFTEFKVPKVASILRDSGAQHHFANLRGSGVNYWSVPSFAQSNGHLKVPKEAEESKDPF
jgi:hypothetical protein